jgi:hypothetical protein
MKHELNHYIKTLVFIAAYLKPNVKVKLTHYTPRKAPGGRKGIAHLFLNLGTKNHLYLLK